ncbi:hypothetical protein [Pseudohoeflea coraliihabitans]|uniref:Ig-like domain-containing protein n=1 Tax=Pseudohoeflea coraliihabitans TaxID=2860393 RepID=A0ABS6WTE0_9HYPH|nr:hypothetical protein [Pseudohoeflea sp. DP4N28-3]MBW3099231.1 hypothetical protein [Pseudohoeflea sp. DP4N28-3]
MSISALFLGGLERPAPVVLSGTTTEDVYEAADDYSTIATVSIANQSGASATVECYFYDGSTDYTVWVGSIDDDVTQVLTYTPLRLLTGHKLRVKGASGITVTPFVTRHHPNEAASNRLG